MTLTFSAWMISHKIYTASMPVSMETSAASSTTCASPTCSPVECSQHTRTFVSHTLPSLPVKTSRLERSLDSTTATTSGKSRASCSAANAALPSASTRQRPWRHCRRTAHRRTSGNPARHLTPALPTVHPVLKTLLTLSFATCTRD